MQNEIYLDHNATTPCAPEVIEAMLPYMSQEFGNPSSPHNMGKRTNSACNLAREFVSDLINCERDEVIFTSGATECNNLVLFGVLDSKSKRRKIVITSIEHKSIIEPCHVLSEKGFEIIKLPVDKNCMVDIRAAADAIDENTSLVSVQGANNEVGVLQPVKEISDIAHEKGALFHCDAAQLLGKVTVSCKELNIDYASFSGHKTYGPKGIGMLFVRRGVARRILKPLFHGGAQEGKLRPGTMNVPCIVGVGEACRLMKNWLRDDIKKISNLRDEFELSIRKRLPFVRINGNEVDRLPGTTSLTIPAVPGSMLIANVPHLLIGEGSACNSGSFEPSHVLLSMGLLREDAECTIRISFGHGNTYADIKKTVDSLVQSIKNLINAINAKEK